MSLTQSTVQAIRRRQRAYTRKAVAYFLPRFLSAAFLIAGLLYVMHNDRIIILSH